MAGGRDNAGSGGATIDQLLSPFREFFRTKASGGVVLLAVTALALAWANSPWAASYYSLWRTELSFGFGGWRVAKSLDLWINDGLMTLFFFMVGLEIKRELLVGELSTRRKALLPIAAAIGGMLLPALLYTLFNAGGPGAAGWGVPMATDIAFALGILALLGDRVCLSLKIFLTAVAIVDDIGAVLVIAFFYTADLHLANLAYAAIAMAGLFAMNRAGVMGPLPYAAMSIVLWACFLFSGIHPTVSGVLAATAIPARPRIGTERFLRKSGEFLEAFRRRVEQGKHILADQHMYEAAQALEVAGRHSQTPLQRLEHLLEPWVSFFIMPVFALANAGVTLKTDIGATLASPVTIGIVAGLVIGKQLGILSFAWIAAKLGIADLPADVSWKDVYGIGWIAGVGFTMSLFIAHLAFGEEGLMSTARVGILGASLIAGVTGWSLFRSTDRCRMPAR